MREPTPARFGEPRPSGVVDTLSAGYGVINRHPWIVLFPLVLDLFLWFGPQISVAPLIGQAATRAGVERGIGAADAQTIESFRQTILAAADEFNLFALLSPGWVSVPAILPVLGKGNGPLTFISSWSSGLLLGLGVLFGGALLGSVYRSIIAQYVCEDRLSPIRVPGQALLAWLRLLGLALILVLGALLLLVPVAFVVALAGLAARELGSFGMALVMTMLLWLQLYLLFAPDAVFVSRVGPIQAIRRSAAVVRANFWAAIRIGVLITIILLGMGQVWLAVANQGPWGTAFGILGNAYIASGLVAASMLFYRERFEALPDRRPAMA